MKYFRTQFNTNKNKESILKSLKTLIYKPSNDFFIFPFFLFSKKYYQSLKKQKGSPFSGNVGVDDFLFEKTIHYGSFNSGRTSRILTIKGNIKENLEAKTIHLEFHSSKFELLIQSIIVITCLVLFVIKENYLFVAIPSIVIFERIYTTLICYFKIKNRLTKTR